MNMKKVLKLSFITLLLSIVIGLSVPTQAQAAAKTKKNIQYTIYKGQGNYIYVLFKNQNKYDIDFNAKMSFYNKKGKEIHVSTDTNYAFQAKTSCVLRFRLPYDKNYKNVSYSKYKLSFDYEKMRNNKISKVKDIKVVKKSSDNYGLKLKVKNNSNTKLEFINLSVLFFDKKGNFIDGDTHYAGCGKKKSTDEVTFYYPYDKNYKTIKPASYKIYVNYAYKYK